MWKTTGAEKYLQGAKGLLIPWGFGNRGIEGKIDAIKFARENKIPFFGICLGLQCAVIEFARTVCGNEGCKQQLNSGRQNHNCPFRYDA